MKQSSILGVDLGGTNIRVGKVFDYNIVDSYSQLISSDGSEQKIISEVIESIKKLVDENIVGIGIGVPSLVDVEKGIIYDVQNIPSWREIHLKQILEDTFKIPVYINNDANCFVVGEKYFGIGKNYDNIVGLIIGTGFGSGLYFDNSLYLGSNCGAGEFGMISYLESNYETYCSGQFFENKLNSNAKEVLSKAMKGDKKALTAFNEFGIHLGNAISTIILAIDPEVIIFGGSVSKAFDYFKIGIYTALKKFPYQSSVKNLKIKISTLSQVAVLGAAALYYEDQGIEASNRMMAKI